MSTLEITRGDDYLDARQLVITVTDEAGAPVDLTGTTATFMVKRRTSDADADAVITKTPTNATQADDTVGVAYIAIAAADTVALAAGSYFYEIQAEDSIGIITLAAGRLTISADLIRGS